MNIPDFSRVFQAGERLNPESDGIILTPFYVGELVLTSGKLVACDPLTLMGAEPFSVTFTPGRYPVILSIAHIQRNNDRRVAYAMLRLSDRTPVRWEMATLPDEDISSLKEGQIFGYGVDAGTGGFMDEEVLQIMDDSIYEGTYQESLTYKLLEALEKNYSTTWKWANMRVDESTEANVIAFSSGWGDGVYATYFGYDAEDNIVSVVTDFEV
ncbi:DUF4241 domain-containing protein [Aerosakkonema funiforme]|uniref:DUF4241 domain-containing protein n=1 Tax=Aerosakkonema funiforme TaxID=1246630 RepID=UPI0035B95A72